MKKTLKNIIFTMVILFCLCASIYGENQTTEDRTKYEPVTKSYVLKYIAPGRVVDALKSYLINYSYDRNEKVVTVVMTKDKVEKFEELLKQMDVEKKKIFMRIFTVVTSKAGKTEEITNPDLKKVISELQKVLSFENYRLEGVSAVTLTEGQERSRLQLSSSFPLVLELGEITIRKDQPNQQSVGFEFRLMQQTEGTLIESETSIKENGYLVAGVSKIGQNGDSLILVINAEIK